MKVTKRQLRRIIRESNLREQAEDRIKFRALFRWDDDEDGSLNQSWEEVSVWAEELRDYAADTPIDLAMAWAHDNLDGAPSLSDVLMHQEDTARVSAWMAGGTPATAKDTQSSQEKAGAGEYDEEWYGLAHAAGHKDGREGKPQSPEQLADKYASSHYKRGYEQGAAGQPRKFREGREIKITKRQLRRIIKEELQFPDDVLVDSDSQDYQQGYADAYDGLKMQKNQSQQYQNGWHDGHFDIVRDNAPYGA